MLRLVHRRTSNNTFTRRERADELASVARAALKGDRSATHALIAALAPHLLRSVRGVLGRYNAEVDDVAQEAALVLLKVLPSYRGEGRVSDFARQTAVLVALNARRSQLAAKRGGHLEPSSVDVDSLASSSDGDPEQTLAQTRAAAAARDLMLSLPGLQAQALALHCVAGCTVAEIAEATGAPLQTVRSRLRLARRALRLRLAAEPTLLELLEKSDETL